MGRIAMAAVLLALTGASMPGRTGPGAAAPALNVGPWPTAMVLDRRTGHAFVLNSGIVMNGRSGRLFVASAPSGGAGPTGAIDVVDLTDGAVLQKIEGLYPQDMAIDEGLNRVYATASVPPGHVAVTDATSGRLIRTVTVGRYPGQVVASARTGHAFVVNGQDGTVSMLDGRSGRVLKTIRVRPAQTNGLFDVEGTLSHLIAVDEKAGRILVGNPSPYRFPNRPCPGRCPALPPILTGPGSVSVLDAATGTVLRTVAVGRAPLAMAVDDIAGHTIILNANGVGPRPGNGSVSIVAITP